MAARSRPLRAHSNSIKQMWVCGVCALRAHSETSGNEGRVSKTQMSMGYLRPNQRLHRRPSIGLVLRQELTLGHRAQISPLRRVIDRRALSEACRFAPLPLHGDAGRIADTSAAWQRRPSGRSGEARPGRTRSDLHRCVSVLFPAPSILRRKGLMPGAPISSPRHPVA
jgi:hypothetical protein